MIYISTKMLHKKNNKINIYKKVYVILCTAKDSDQGSLIGPGAVVIQNYIYFTTF